MSLSDVSHHMFDTFIAGPDATRLLSDVSAQQLRELRGRPGQAVRPGDAATGDIVTDGILAARRPSTSTSLSGIPAAQNWVKYHGEKGGYDVAFTTDPSTASAAAATRGCSATRSRARSARELVETVFDGPLPPSKFFHSIPVALDGRASPPCGTTWPARTATSSSAPWEHAAFVKDTLLSAGAKFGIVHVGALAYASASVESGWVPSPVPAIYTDPGPRGLPQLAAALRHRGAAAAQRQLLLRRTSRTTTSHRGSSATAARSPSTTTSSAATHCAPRRETAPRVKVTLVLHPAGRAPRCSATTTATTSPTPGTGSSCRGDGNLVGLTHQTATLDTAGTILALTLINKEHAAPGTEVTVTWGEHPGAGTATDADLGFPKIRATVAPAPYDAYAATQYRRH